MDFLFEVFFEFLGEFALEFVLQALAELGARMVLASLGSRASSVLRVPGLALLGAALGGATLLMLPNRLLASHALRVANLLLTPVLVGALMAMLGAHRFRRGLVVLPIDRFVGGFAFALAFAIVRFVCAR
jgi:hypothetical protein